MTKILHNISSFPQSYTVFFHIVQHLIERHPIWIQICLHLSHQAKKLEHPLLTLIVERYTSNPRIKRWKNVPCSELLELPLLTCDSNVDRDKDTAQVIQCLALIPPSIFHFHTVNCQCTVLIDRESVTILWRKQQVLKTGGSKTK